MGAAQHSEKMCTDQGHEPEAEAQEVVAGAGVQEAGAGHRQEDTDEGIVHLLHQGVVLEATGTEGEAPAIALTAVTVAAGVGPEAGVVVDMEEGGKKSSVLACVVKQLYGSHWEHGLIS